MEFSLLDADLGIVIDVTDSRFKLRYASLVGPSSKPPPVELCIYLVARIRLRVKGIVRCDVASHNESALLTYLKYHFPREEKALKIRIQNNIF
jgi:hypothetical protein